MLSGAHHPCQALADLLTSRRPSAPSPACVSRTWATATTSRARSLCSGPSSGWTSPSPRRPATRSSSELEPAAEDGGRSTLHTDPDEAVAGAQALYTDVWVSMGDERAALSDAGDRRLPHRRPLLEAAAPGAIALHCLPAHPGEEITAEVLYGPRQRIWDQAENRRHAQKALLELLLGCQPGQG